MTGGLDEICMSVCKRKNYAIIIIIICTCSSNKYVANIDFQTNTQRHVEVGGASITSLKMKLVQYCTDMVG